MEYVDGLCIGAPYELSFFIEVAVTFVLPFVIICTSNVIIIYNLSRRVSSHKKIDSNVALTKTLIFVCIAFLVTYSPIYIVDTLIWFGVQLPAALDKLYGIFIILMNMNGCLNFPLYFLTGSKFRKALFQLFQFRRTPTVSKIQSRKSLAIIGDSLNKPNSVNDNAPDY